MDAMKFYEEMAKAIKDRDHANSMAAKWTTKASEAEAKIDQLVAEQDQTEQPQEG